MDNRRTETARGEDDSQLLEGTEPNPGQGGRSGGSLQGDVATEAELERVRDPEARHGVDKQEKIDHQQESSTKHPPDTTV